MGGAGAAVTDRVGAFAAGGTACDSTSASCALGLCSGPAPRLLFPYDEGWQSPSDGPPSLPHPADTMPPFLDRCKQEAQALQESTPSIPNQAALAALISFFLIE